MASFEWVPFETMKHASYICIALMHCDPVLGTITIHDRYIPPQNLATLRVFSVSLNKREHIPRKVSIIPPLTLREIHKVLQ